MNQTLKDILTEKTARLLANKTDSLGRTNLMELQLNLIELGYDTKGIDGLIGPNTCRAIINFLKDHKGKYAHEISPAIRDYIEYKTSHRLEFQQLSRTANIKTASLSDLLSIEGKFLPGEISRLQQLLKPYGYNDPVDDLFGPKTAGALINYLKQNPVLVHSVEMQSNTPALSFTLLQKLTDYPQYSTELKQMTRSAPGFAPRVHILSKAGEHAPEQPLQMQILLKAAGYYGGAIDGVHSAQIDQALQSFLKETGSEKKLKPEPDFYDPPPAPRIKLAISESFTAATSALPDLASEPSSIPLPTLSKKT